MTIAGVPAVDADMLLLFDRVERPPPGAWRDDLHRAEPQSALWHIGAYTNTTDLAARLRPAGVALLPLFTAPGDSVGVWRSGLAPYAGTRTAGQLDTVTATAPRPGGFAYAVAPDGVLFEFTGGPATRDALSHVHLYHERPGCAAAWYAAHLGMPPTAPVACETVAGSPPSPPPAAAEASWPSLERIGTIRAPAAGVRLANGALAWYPRQCVGARCGGERPLVPSRGQALDHVALAVDGLEALLARLRRAGVRVREAPHAGLSGRAAMIEGPDGLAIELLERPRREPDASSSPASRSR